MVSVGYGGGTPLSRAPWHGRPGAPTGSRLPMRRLPTSLAALACAATLTLTACGPSSDGQGRDGQGGDGATSSASASATPTPTQTPELFGGGTRLFPEHRFVALYGHPGTPALGALGEQGPEESAQRAIELAEAYQPHSDEKVVPAFELIATTASSDPGPDGDYSSETPAKELEPYLDAAEKHGVYVVLDLQPGHSDFLDQAEQYEELLKKPNVGLALDPEWRLAPGQVHMQQIGSVDAAEINRVADWLAELTRENDLPQKALVLHQFADSMITNRAAVDTSHPELAVILHADGHGTPDLKLGTWKRLQQDLPKGVHMAWKNFHDEDTPTFTPEQTYAIDPKPWFVSYQ